MNVKKYLFSSGGLLSLLALVFLCLAFWKFGMTKLGSSKQNQPETTGTGPTTDITKNDLDKYKNEYLNVRQSIRITIVDTQTEYEVRALPGNAPTTGAFLVTPKQAPRFTSDIESLVNGGLEPIPLTENSPYPPKWSGYTISTNKDERTWTVVLHGVSGGGQIRLSVEEASDVLQVELPRILPIWRYATFVNARSGIVVVGGYDVKVGETIQPDLSQGLCGFRVHSISNRAVWFEVVYAEPNPSLTRSQWPDLRIDYAELDNGESHSKVIFEGGLEMEKGKKAVFDEEGDYIKLDSGAFRSERAVLFRYLDRNHNPIADMIVVTFQR